MKSRNVELVASGRGIREEARLKRCYGSGRWRKLKGIAKVRWPNGVVRSAEVHWYEAHGIGKRDLKRDSSTDGMDTRIQSRHVVCIHNDGVAASLEPRKIYEQVPDDDAARVGMVRVIDESGEDYLYPSDWFAPIELSRELQSVLRLAS